MSENVTGDDLTPVERLAVELVKHEDMRQRPYQWGRDDVCQCGHERSDYVEHAAPEIARSLGLLDHDLDEAECDRLGWHIANQLGIRYHGEGGYELTKDQCGNWQANRKVATP